MHIRVWCCISLSVVILLVVLARMSHPRKQLFTNAGGTASIDGKCVYDQTSFSSANRVVMYYAPWCTQCTDFRPEFDKAASQAMSLGLDVCFATVNSDTQGDECVKFKGATVLPTIQLEVGVNPVPPFALYNGLRNATDLFSWVKASLPAKQA